MIVSIHGLKIYFDLPYRWILDILYKVSRTARFLSLKPIDLPVTIACARIEELKNAALADFLRLSAKLQDTGETQAIDVNLTSPGIQSYEYRPLGLRELAAFIHCISSLCMAVIHDQQGKMMPSNGSRASSGQFEAVEIISTTPRSRCDAEKLLNGSVKASLSNVSEFPPVCPRSIQRYS